MGNRKMVDQVVLEHSSGTIFCFGITINFSVKCITYVWIKEFVVEVLLVTIFAP